LVPRIAAGLLAVEMCIDEILDGKIRVVGNGGLDLVMQRRELGVHHDDAVVADHDEDVAALAFEHVGLAAEIGGLDLRHRGIGPLRPGGACREHCCRGQLH
jgi:hypothetical protein